MLSDFGISRLLLNSVTIAGTTSLKENARCMAPELMLCSLVDEHNGHNVHTKTSDVWAYGMVLYVSDNLRFKFIY